MNGRVHTSIKTIHFASAIRSLDKHCFLPLFANEIKNDITSSETHNCMSA